MMMNTRPPLVATNKDLSAISSGFCMTPVATAMNVPTSVNNPTQSQINAKNLICITHNDAL